MQVKEEAARALLAKLGIPSANETQLYRVVGLVNRLHDLDEGEAVLAGPDAVLLARIVVERLDGREVGVTPRPPEEAAPKPPKERRPHKNDRFGTRRGSRAAKVNEFLDATPRSPEELCRLANLTVANRIYGHLARLVEKGHVVKTPEGCYKVRADGDPLAGPKKKGRKK